MYRNGPELDEMTTTQKIGIVHYQLGLTDGVSLEIENGKTRIHFEPYAYYWLKG